MDKDRHYHNFAVAVTTKETADDYAFVFEAIKDGAKNVKIISLMCWAHMRKAVQKNILKTVTEKEDKECIINDLDILQLLPNKQIFDLAVKLY